MGDYLASVALAAQQHTPVVETGYAYECANGDCEHQDDPVCPLTEFTVCAYCFWLNGEMEPEMIYPEVLAKNCPVCVAVMGGTRPSLTFRFITWLTRRGTNG